MKRHLHIPAYSNYQYPTGELQSLTNCLVEFLFLPRWLALGNAVFLNAQDVAGWVVQRGLRIYFIRQDHKKTNSRKQNKTEYFNRKEN